MCGAECFAAGTDQGSAGARGSGGAARDEGADAVRAGQRPDGAEHAEALPGADCVLLGDGWQLKANKDFLKGG